MSDQEDEDRGMPDANGDAAEVTPETVQYGELSISSAQDTIAAGVAAGNIHLQATDAATLALPEASKEARQQQERLLQVVEERRALRETNVPTSDADVRAALRAISEPVTLFGEQQMERRARLRKIMATMDEEDERRAALPASRGPLESSYAPLLPMILATKRAQKKEKDMGASRTLHFAS